MLINDAIVNALEIAALIKMKTIAMPISFEVGSLATDSRLLLTVMQWTMVRKGSTVKEIRLIDKNMQTVRAVKA
jgi:hypothetical protein